MAQTYLAVGEKEAMLDATRGFAVRELGIEGSANPDIIVREFALFSVDDARALRDIATLAAVGEHKTVIVSVERIFHEAQNALLKLFEEPPEDTTLILIVPTAGILLGTMRSRLVPLPLKKVSGKKTEKKSEAESIGTEFLDATATAREKLVMKLLDRAKSDKDDEKQAARADALRILEALERCAHEAWTDGEAGPKKSADYALFLRDLDRFIPILHERSAPLKQIFEHLLIVMPNGL